MIIDLSTWNNLLAFISVIISYSFMVFAIGSVRGSIKMKKINDEYFKLYEDQIATIDMLLKQLKEEREK